MKTRRLFSQNRGWALVSVLTFSAILLLIGGSLLTYSSSERRLNEQHRLQLKARNMAENIANYASEQLTLKLKRTRNASPRAFIGGVNQMYLPPDSVTTSLTSSASDMEVWAGLTSQTGFQFIDPVTNPTNPYAGLQVNTATVPIISKAYFKNNNAKVSATSYANYDLSLALVPIFQFGLFYNMDLEITPGGDMTIAGPVHTNGRLAARTQHQRSNTIRFTERVSAVEGVYANVNMKVTMRTGDGSVAGGTPGDANGGDGPVIYTNPSGTGTNMYSSFWRDHMWGGSTETATTQNNFKTFATNTYASNLRTYLHGITKLSLPGIGDYKETDDASTTGDDRENGRQIIDPPASTDTVDLKFEKVSYRSGLYIVVNPDDVTRSARLPNGTTVSMPGFSYRCWLNTFNSDGTNSMTEIVLPGQPSYGDNNATQNNRPNRFTNASYVGTNQVLRIPASGRSADNVITSVSGVGVQLGYTGTLSTGYPSGVSSPGPYPAFTDAYFYDLRRATGNRGYPFNRSSNTYTPRPIAKIDFDVTRFKMCLERTLYQTTACNNLRPVYDVSSTHTSYTDNFNLMKRSVGSTIHGVWKRHIFNPSADPTSSTSTISLLIDTSSTGLNLTGSSKTTVENTDNVDPFRMFNAATGTPITASDLVSNSAACPWFDGIAVYVHSIEAEKRASAVVDATGRVDSGVRLINARGAAPSLDATSYPSKTGFTFATNDALYVIGHFNAHGKNLNLDYTSSSYSGRYPSDGSEKLCSLMADAITILTQPVFEGPSSDSSTVTMGATGADGYPVFSQERGWADALSHLRTVFASGISSNQISNWRTTDPSTSNTYDGLGSASDNARSGVLPTLQLAVSTSPQFTQKNLPTDTEISAALLVGIVPSNHNPTGLITPAPSSSSNGASSGGAHNFPRLLENWSQSATRTATQIQSRTDASSNGNASNLIIRGSMVAAFESRVAVEPWSIRYYSAPSRHWGLHEGFRQVDHDVPLEPILLNTSRMNYRELTPVQYAAWKAIIQALPTP